MGKVKTLVLVMLLATLASCSSIRKSTKQLSKVETKTEVSETEAKSGDLRQVDKSVEVITEKAKGVAYTAPKQAETANKLDRLRAGEIIEYRDGLISLSQQYDSLSDEIRTKVEVAADSAEYDVDKTTVRNNDIVSEGKFTEQKNRVEESSHEALDKSSEKEWSTAGKIVTGLSVLAVLIIVILLIKRFVLK